MCHLDFQNLELSLKFQMPNPINWMRPFSILWLLDGIFQILIENSVSKQLRPWSDATFYGIRSGSALFVYVP